MHKPRWRNMASHHRVVSIKSVSSEVGGSLIVDGGEEDEEGEGDEEDGSHVPSKGYFKSKVFSTNNGSAQEGVGDEDLLCSSKGDSVSKVTHFEEAEGIDVVGGLLHDMEVGCPPSGYMGNQGGTEIIYDSLDPIRTGVGEGMVKPEAYNSVFTLFVDNIPPSTPRRWFWEVFGKFGKMCGVFISRKRRKNCRNCFGFVRFCYKADAVQAKGKTNGMRIGDQVLYVDFPRFDQKSRDLIFAERIGKRKLGQDQFAGGISEHNLGHAKPASSAGFGPTYAQMVSGEGIQTSQSRKVSSISYKDQNGRKKVFGKAFNMEWLNRCAVAYVKLPNMIHKIAEILTREFSELKKVCFLSNKQLLMEFVSMATRDEFITLGSWDDLFVHISPWKDDLACHERSVWLECSGIPIQSWSINTFKEIAELWGSLVCVFDETLSFKNCNKAFILISTKEEVFDNVLDFVLDNRSFEVKIREVVSPGCKDYMAKFLYEEDRSVFSTADGHKIVPVFSPEGGSDKARPAGLEIMDQDDQATAILSQFEEAHYVHSVGFCAEDELHFHSPMLGFVGYGSSGKVCVVPAAQDEVGDNSERHLGVLAGTKENTRPVQGIRNEQEAIKKVNEGCSHRQDTDLGVQALETNVLNFEDGLGDSGIDDSIANGKCLQSSRSDPVVEAVISTPRVSPTGNLRPVHLLAAKGYRILSMSNFEALTNGLIEGVSEAFDVGESMGIMVPDQFQASIKAVMGKRQILILKTLFDNG